MGIGTLAHTVGKRPLRELTAKLQGRRIEFVQLALAKAISDINTETGALSPGLANYIAEQFDRAGIRIGVLGCYINPIHPDADLRRREIARFKEHLRYARDFGTSIVATETPGLDVYADMYPERYEEAAWQELKQTVTELAEEAERWGVTVGLEPVSSHVLSSAEKAGAAAEGSSVLHAGCRVRSVQFGDAFRDERAERISGQRLQQVRQPHRADAFEGRGRYGRKAQTMRAGTGTFETESFLRKLELHKPHVDISLEEVSDTDLDETVALVRGMMETLR